ncbi:MAG: phosphoglycerate dehydrogenase [Verrucomicrobiales bacterium]
MTKHKVLIADPIADAGINELQADQALDVDVRIGISPDDLLADAAAYEAIIVRSRSKISADVLNAAKNLKIVGRAGVGVDNIDVPAATKNGVIVVNTPAGNTISTAEHAFSMMAALARHIPQAHATVSAGGWGRKDYNGVELNKKTLTILGMGRIGTEFARRAIAFGMRVVVYDPYLSPSRARALQVELFQELEDAVENADFITLHMPLTDDTRHIINTDLLKACKPGVRIINCARGGLIDEQALLKAINSGHIAGAALDVYEQSEPPPAGYPLLQSNKIIFTPHLGASTAEAQENVGIEISRNIRNFLIEGTIVNSINTPSIDGKTAELLGPYLDLAEAMGKMLSQLAPGGVEFLTISYSGKMAELDTALVTRAALKGYLERACGGESVNHINAPGVAEKRGLTVSETRPSDAGEFTEMIEIIADAAEEKASVSGTFFGTSPRIVKINEYRVEADAVGHVLIVSNTDVPGVIGTIGTVIANHKANIAGMSLSRNQVGKRALTVINLDAELTSSARDELLADENIHSAKLLCL